ncbi:MAG TPA: hypothetical protein VNE82_14015 [Candidatus Binataceae bacterium]|nr:hypothetical protein [Candidatus Binataceae bacterium]
MAGSERSERSRLKANLRKLDQLEPADLVREDLQPQNLSFRSGLPYFERTLGLFRGLGRGNLAKVPSAYLKIVADHAERALAQFDEILRFNGTGLPHASEVRNHLIAEVRDYYRELHDDVAILITLPPGQQEHSTGAPWYAGAPLAVIMFAIFAAGVAAAYHYGLLTFAAQDILDSLHEIAHQ